MSLRLPKVESQYSDILYTIHITSRKLSVNQERRLHGHWFGVSKVLDMQASGYYLVFDTILVLWFSSNRAIL